MKYFTKQTMLDYNSPNRKIAEKAKKQAERRRKAYWKYIESICPQLTRKTARFFKTMSLHDGSLMAIRMQEFVRSNRFKRNNFVEIEVEHPEVNYVYTLRYSDVSKFRIDYPSETPLSWDEPYTFGTWGYDELFLMKNGLLRHEILFLSGATIRLEFKTFSHRRRNAEINEGGETGN